MRYEITRRAFKQLGHIPQPQRGRIYEAIKAMCAEWPQARNVKSLAGRGDMRLRVGDYRVLFTVAGDVIQVEEVKKRDERTY